MHREYTESLTTSMMKYGKIRKEYTVWYEGEFEMEDRDEFGMELVGNLGNYASLRAIAKRKGESSVKVGETLMDDLVNLKNEFIKRHPEFFDDLDAVAAKRGK